MEIEVPKLIIYLVRHAQTSGNVSMTWGHEEDLTQLGRIQANLLGMHLARVRFDGAFASDYNRAVSTAIGILNQNQSVAHKQRVQIDKRLGEVDLGELDGKSYNDIFKYCTALSKPVLQWSFPGGESLTEAGQRLLNFIQEICVKFLAGDKRLPVSTLLIVSHSGSIAMFLNAVVESRVHKVAAWNPNTDFKLMENACYMKIEVALTSSDGISSSRIGQYAGLEKCQPQFQFSFLEKHESRHLKCGKASPRNLTVSRNLFTQMHL